MTKNNVKLLNNYKDVLSQQLLRPPSREHPQTNYIIMSRYDCRYKCQWWSICNVIWKNPLQLWASRSQMIVRRLWQDVMDQWTVSSLEVNRSQLQDGFGSTDQQRGSTDQTRTEAQCHAELSTMPVSFNLIRSGARSQWKLTRVFVMWAERWRPGIARAAALNTDCDWVSWQEGQPM